MRANKVKSGKRHQKMTTEKRKVGIAWLRLIWNYVPAGGAIVGLIYSFLCLLLVIIGLITEMVMAIVESFANKRSG